MSRTIHVWIVSAPNIVNQGEGTVSTGANVWCPLCVLRCDDAKSAISAFSYSELDKLLLAGNVRGDVVMWICKENAKKDTTNIFHEFLRWHFVDKIVTSALIVAAASTVVFGCASGEVLVCCDWETKEILPATTTTRVGADGAVLDLSVHTLWYQGDLHPVVYICWASGHIGIMHLITRDLIAFSKGPSIPLSDRSKIMCSRFSTILDENSNVCEVPEELLRSSTAYETAIYDDPVELSSTLIPGLHIPNPKAVRKIGAFFKKFENPEDLKKMGASIVNKIKHPGQSDQASDQAPPVPTPSDAPKYLLRAVAGSIVTYDLSKFAVLGSQGKFSANDDRACSVMKISEQPLIGVQLVKYLEEAARAWADPIDCLVCVDVSARAKVISVKEQQLWGSASLLEGVISSHGQLSDCIVLSNGDIFVQEFSSIVHLASLTSPQYIQSLQSPIKSSALVACPPKTYQLKNGRDMAGAKTAKARKQSIFGAGVADLDRVFSKTRDERQREELLGSSGIDEDEEEEDDKHKSAKHVSKTSAQTKQTMLETRQAFEERGERVSRIANKTDNFKEAARIFKEETAAEKERLKKKAARWGIF